MYLLELNSCQTIQDIRKSNDSLDTLMDSYYAQEFLQHLDKYQALILVQYDRLLLFQLLDEAVVRGVTSSPPQLAIFNGFLDALPADNRYLVNDLERWAREGVEGVRAFLKRENERGWRGTDWKRCAYAADMCDFVATCIVPRLRVKTNERWTVLSDLKEQIMELWYFKLTEDF